MCIVMLVLVDIVQVVRMGIRQVQPRRVVIVNVVRHLEHVINVVRLHINTHVMEQGIRPVLVLRVVVSLRVVHVLVGITGLVVLV